MRSMSQGGNAMWKVVTAVVLLVGLAVTIGSCWFSEEARIERMVETARDDLVENRGEAFLAHFAEDVRYQGGKTKADLTRDLARWQASGRLRIYLRETLVEVDATGADVELQVAVGLSILQAVPIQVILRVDRDDDGGYLVTRFDWSRQ